MIPYILAAVGGYLIGQSQKKDVPQMAKGGVIDVVDKYNRLVLPKEVYSNGKIYKGDATFINGYNGYTSSKDDGYLVDNDGNYLKDAEGKILRSKERRGLTIKISDGEIMAKGGETDNYSTWNFWKNEYENYIQELKEKIKADYDDDEVSFLTKQQENELESYQHRLEKHLEKGKEKGWYGKGGTTDDVEVSLNLTKEEGQLLYVVLDTKLKDEGKKIPKIKERIQSKLTEVFSEEAPDEVELRISVEDIMLIYLYMEEVQKKEPTFKPKTFTKIRKKLYEAVKRSNKALPKHFAQGGVLEHGLREGDRILVINDQFAGIIDKDGQRVVVNIEQGKRRESTI